MVPAKKGKLKQEMIKDANVQHNASCHYPFSICTHIEDPEYENDVTTKRKCPQAADNVISKGGLDDKVMICFGLRG